MKGMAFHEPDGREIPSLEHPVLFEGKAGIGGACGVKTAGRRKKGGYKALIYSYN